MIDRFQEILWMKMKELCFEIVIQLLFTNVLIWEHFN